MEYNGFVLDHCDVYNEELGWHKFGVIINVGEKKDFTCTGLDLNELETNFKLLVESNLEELEELTSIIDLELDTQLMERIKSIDGYERMSSEEVVTRIILKGFGAANI